jgi:glycosyltransferase involved in cell wall biosynthesis
MYRVYLPYKIGGDSPIPHLFEQIVPEFDADEFRFTVYAWEHQHQLPRNVRQITVSRDHRFLRHLKYLSGAPRRYDLIHTGGRRGMHYHLSRLAHLRNRNLAHVHTFRVDVDFSLGESGEPLRDDYEKRLPVIERADALTAVSEHTAETARQKLGVDPTVIYNGVDTELFNPDYDRPKLFDELSIDSETPVFLFVGSLESRKRPLDVIDIAAHVPEAEFVFIGDGPLMNMVRTTAVNNDRIHIAGRLQKSRLPAIYANATGLVFPSTKEGCPNVVLEAMATGTPVAGYEATSMPELVTTGETGHLSRVGDTEAASDGVKDIIDHAEEWGTAARRYVEANHTFDLLATQYQSVYRSVL